MVILLFTGFAVIVINHTTGERFENIEVSGTDNPDPSENIINASTALDIWRNMVPVINEDRLNGFFNTLAEELNFQRKRFFITNTVDDIIFTGTESVDPPYQMTVFLGGSDIESGEFASIDQRSVYSCEQGGQVYNYIDTTRTGTSDSLFDDCAVGLAIYSGNTGTRNLIRGVIATYPYVNFTRVENDSLSTSVTGNHIFGNTSFVVADYTSGWRDLEFTETSADGIFSVSNYTVTRKFDDTPAFSAIAGSFSVKAQNFGADALQVEINLSSGNEISTNPNDAFIWENVDIQIMAADESSMRIFSSPENTGQFSIELNSGDTIGPLPLSGDYSILPYTL